MGTILPLHNVLIRMGTTLPYTMKHGNDSYKCKQVYVYVLVFVLVLWLSYNSNMQVHYFCLVLHACILSTFNHTNANFMPRLYHNIGVGYYYPSSWLDPGF